MRRDNFASIISSQVDAPFRRNVFAIESVSTPLSVFLREPRRVQRIPYSVFRIPYSARLDNASRFRFHDIRVRVTLLTPPRRFSTRSRLRFLRTTPPRACSFHSSRREFSLCFLFHRIRVISSASLINYIFIASRESLSVLVSEKHTQHEPIRYFMLLAHFLALRFREWYRKYNGNE